jgi:hypothetical protein
VSAHSVGDHEEASAGVMRLQFFVGSGVRPEVLILGPHQTDVGPKYGTNDKATGRAG